MSATSLNAGVLRAQHGKTAGALATTGARAPRYIQRGFPFATIGSDSATLAGVRGDAFATARNIHI